VVLEKICAGEGLVVEWKTGFDTGRNLCRGRLALVLEESCAGEGLVVEWKTGCIIGRICPIEDWLWYWKKPVQGRLGCGVED
jgi:hypothetical protein